MSSVTDCPSNLALKNLCETFLQERNQRTSAGTEVLCSLHNEKLKLFCLEDKQPPCLLCRDSKKHKAHHFSFIPEAAQDRKEELDIKRNHMKKKVDIYNQVKNTWVDCADYIKIQAQHTEWQIKDEFEKLHQFLQDEEAARIAALREEEKQKYQIIKEKIDLISKKVSLLLANIRAIEEKMGADDVTFLQAYKSVVERAQCTQQNPERVSGALVSVSKHLGNLKFRVWEKLRNVVQYTHVTLDPNTAHPQLIFSEDLLRVTCGDAMQQLPDNSERFDQPPCVLGSESFNSGTHYWEVEVGDSKDWFLGVKAESGQRKGWISLSSGIWCMFHANGEYAVFAPAQPDVLLRVQSKPQRITVQLDYDRGKLSFYDPVHNTHLHTFSHTFTERVFPYFRTKSSLKLLPVRPLVTVGHFHLKNS